MANATRGRSAWARIKRVVGFAGAEEGVAPRNASDIDSALPEQQGGSSIQDDSPIDSPSQDRFGVDAFAGIVAGAVLGQGTAEGTVVALNGPWGVGKSSAVNLVVRHLGERGGEDLEVIRFNPWWFSGSDQLARAFLGELASKIGRTITDDGRDALTGMFARLTRFDNYVEAARRAGDDGVGSGVAALLFDGRTVEDDHRRLSEALTRAGRRFVVIIDDIDRLNPDEALQMFQLVKSVGRLPRVTYLLAFDRLLIERLLAERYPSEGGHYLEKVLQATFDLPDPSPAVLRAMTLEAVEQLVDVEDEQGVRFMNLFEDVVVPRLTTPRQVVRYLGSLRVSWPAVSDEVDPADFMAIEAIRVFEPVLYRAIRSNGPFVRGEDKGNDVNVWRQEADRRLIEIVGEDRREWARNSLRRLFPAIEGAWGGPHYSDDFASAWNARRLVCTQAHFPTYFSYAVPPETLRGSERRELIAATAAPDQLRALLMDGLAKLRSDGGTRAALMLDALTTMGDLVPSANIPAMLQGLFAIGDDLEVEADRRRGFGLADNRFRLHWIVNGQVRERIPFEGRPAVIGPALAVAQVGWRMEFADRLAHDYDPPKSNEREPRVPLVEEEEARRLQAEAVAMMVSGAKDGSILRSSRAISLLWRLTHEPGGEGMARSLTDGLLATEEGVVRLADMITTTTWSQGMGFADMGDRVARGSPRVQRDGLERILDSIRLSEKARGLVEAPHLGEGNRAKLKWSLRGWDNPDRD